MVEEKLAYLKFSIDFLYPIFSLASPHAYWLKKSLGQIVNFKFLMVAP